ncbi:MAG: hypothetical protein K8F24_01770, partial [Bacteroidales bacterium]|nr:hypothetical protein [Bacteroidales bacterium]
MATQFTSKALEANLAETRYRDIYTPENHQDFIQLSAGYFGIKKRATDCITEFHHPLSNRKFVIEELREMLITDFWFYAKDEMPANALEVPLEMMQELLNDKTACELRMLIARTLLELVSLITGKSDRLEDMALKSLVILDEGFAENKGCFIISSNHFSKHLNKLVENKRLKKIAFKLLKAVKTETYRFWQTSTTAERWAKKEGELLSPKEVDALKQRIGEPYFQALSRKLEAATSWDQLNELP